jgi:hypothetical protein
LTRKLTYQTHFLINGTLLETQTGDIIPVTSAINPLNKVFLFNNIDVTQSELRLLQDFYQKYYLQQFLFTDIENAQKTFVTLETPNGIATQFNLVNDTPNLLYLLNSAKIYVNNQLIPSATINENLTVTFTTPPANNGVVTAMIDYDYAVMFDYAFGLQSVFDPKTQTFKISFQLVVC